MSQDIRKKTNHQIQTLHETALQMSRLIRDHIRREMLLQKCMPTSRFQRPLRFLEKLRQGV